MEIRKTKLEGFYGIVSKRHIDDRGFLGRLYDEEIFKSFGLETKWVQASWSHTSRKYTVRGLHFQFPPFVETKLIGIIKGEVLWVVVDLRKNSQTFGCWNSYLLSDNNGSVVYVKGGFAHGCVSLSNDCDMMILSNNYFSKGKGGGIIWDDPDLKIDWNLDGITPIISEEHKKYPTFKRFKEEYGSIAVK